MPRRRLVVLALLVLPLSATLAAPRKPPLRFDFNDGLARGRTSPTAEGHIPVYVDTRYPSADGYGWVAGPPLVSRDRGEPDPLRRDFHFGQDGQSLFRVEVPPGLYKVTVTTGDVLAGDHVLTVEAEGVVKVKDLNPKRLQFTDAVFGVQVQDGRLDLAFSSSRSNWIVNALVIEPVAGLAGLETTQFRTTTQADPATARRKAQMAPSRDVRPLKVVKPASVKSDRFPWLADYMQVLERFPLYAERGWHPFTTPQGEELGWFGDEDHEEMGMRAMGNFVFVAALLATDPAYDPAPTGISREQVLLRALQCLEYMLRCHVTGDLTRPTGRKWGNNWQSSWWASRMMTGAHLLWRHLSPEEKKMVERVVAHEADRHLPRTAPSAASQDTKSEENAWDTEILSWAAASFPSHRNAPLWKGKSREMMMNSLSVEADRVDERLVDGVAVSKQVYTSNINPDFTIENHGAYHFCYMACPLHSLAWSWYAYNANGRPSPEAAWHHVQDVFGVIRKTFLFESRFAYLGGNDWPRYAYGEYFILPALVLQQNVHDDRDARLFERGRFTKLAQEQAANADGTFFGARFTKNIMMDRQAEFETDCYAMLGLAYLLHKMEPAPIDATPPERFQQSVAGAWRSEPSGFVVARAPGAFTSMSWRMLEPGKVFGLFIPRGTEDMAEWGTDQLAGRFEIEGSEGRSPRIEHQDALLQDGFTTTGHMREGMSGEAQAIDHVVSVTSMPARGFMLVMDRAVAARAATVTLDEGLRLHVANDLFNANSRRLTSAAGEMVLEGVTRGAKEAVRSIDSAWLGIDDALGLARLSPAAPFVVRDFAERNARHGSLLYELIDTSYVTAPRAVRPGDVVRDTAVALVAGGPRAAQAFLGGSRLIPVPAGSPVRAVLAASEAGPVLVVSNLDPRPAEVELDLAGLQEKGVTFQGLSLSGTRARISLKGLGTRVFTP